MLLTAFGIKAAVFPLSAWLPDSYPTAAAPVTAVFAGLLTKVGVYSIIRTQTLLFPDSGLVDDVLMVAALATMVIGALGAIAQDDIKRDAVVHARQPHRLHDLRGGARDPGGPGRRDLLRRPPHHRAGDALLRGGPDRAASAAPPRRRGSPGSRPRRRLLAVLYFVPAVNLGGIPPLSGFVGKLGLVEAGVQDGSVLAWMLVGGAVLTSLLTLYVMAKVWVLAFWRPADQLPGEEPVREDGAEEAGADERGGATRS